MSEYETRMVIGNYLTQAIASDRLYEAAALMANRLGDMDKSVYEVCDLRAVGESKN